MQPSPTTEQKLRGGKIVLQPNGTCYKPQHKFLSVQICSLINKLLLVPYFLTPYHHYAYVSLVWLQNIIEQKYLKIFFHLMACFKCIHRQIQIIFLICCLGVFMGSSHRMEVSFLLVVPKASTQSTFLYSRDTSKHKPTVIICLCSLVPSDNY